MEFKGTKETWCIEKDIPMFDGGYKIYWNRIRMKDNEILIKGKDFHEVSANTNLIACAPELLHHVNNLKEELESMVDVKEIPKIIKAGIIQQIKLTEELIKRATE